MATALKDNRGVYTPSPPRRQRPRDWQTPFLGQEFPIPALAKSWERQSVFSKQE